MMRHLLTSLGLAALLGGCAITGDCSGDAPSEPSGETPPVESVETADIPEGPDALTEAIARTLPADASGVVVVRDFEAILQWYPALRDRISAHIGELRQLEAEVRNTFGIDLRDPSTFGDVGIASRGALGVANINDETVYTFFLSDAGAFEERLRRVLSLQPFNLRAEVEEQDVDGFRALLFRRRPEQPARVIVAIHDDMAFVARPGYHDEAPLDWLETLAASREATYADGASFAPLVAGLSESDVVALISAAEALGESREVLAEELDPEVLAAREADLERISQLGTFGLGLQGADDHLRLDAVAIPEAELQGLLGQASPSAADATRFASLMTDDVYFFARTSLNPAALIALARAVLPAPELAAFNAAGERADELLQIDVEAEVIPALGDNQILMATRVRLLTLSRAMGGNSISLPDLFGALGVVGAVEVRDRAQLVSVFDRLAELHGNRVSRFDEGSHAILQFTDPSLDIGNLVLTDDLLVLVPSRQRDDVLARLASAEAYDLSDIRDDGARLAVTQAGESAIFVDLTEIRTGAAGALLMARIPEELRGFVEMLDELAVTMRATDAQVTGDATLWLADVETDE